jgi:hexosaminidase
MVYLIAPLVPLALCLRLVAALWPSPTNLTTGTTFLRLSQSFSIDVNIPQAPSDLLDAVSRTKAFLVQDRLQRLVVGRGVNDAQRIQAAKALPSLAISIVGTRSIQNISNEAILDLNDRNEAYSLTVPSDGSEARLTAESTLGLFRGLMLAVSCLFLDLYST